MRQYSNFDRIPEIQFFIKSMWKNSNSNSNSNFKLILMKILKIGVRDSKFRSDNWTECWKFIFLSTSSENSKFEFEFEFQTDFDENPQNWS